MPRERITHTRRVYDGRVVALRVDDVQLPSGRTALREIVEHRGAVAIVPVTPELDVLLVRQFRSAVGDELLEVPAGTIEPGESVQQCLERELAEEIGMRAAHYTHLMSFFPSPGFLTEEVHLYLATDFTPHRLEAEEEDLAVVRLPLAEARTRVLRHQIRDAKSIIGLLLAAERLGGA